MIRYQGRNFGFGGSWSSGLLIAKAMGHHVIVISSSDKKRAEAFEHLGGDAFIASSNTEEMEGAADSLDYVLDTVPAVHPLQPYVSLLRFGGKLILVGIVTTPLHFE